MLPKGCVKKIESLCSRFLWSGQIEVVRGAKVNWHTVCLPKEEGGLGLRKYTLWNKVLCLRFIWLLFSDSESLWAAWHKRQHLNDKSFWSVSQSNADSWTWKTLLSLRPLASQFIHGNVGNGLLLSFWFDSWLQGGCLIDLFGEHGPRELGIPLTATLSDVSNGTAWTLSSPRSDNALQLHIALTSVSPPRITDVEDSYSWKINGTVCNGFSSSKTWDAVRPREPPKAWASTVWYKGAVPKQAFNMWLATLNRLPTKGRLVSWGLNINPSCDLCNSSVETRDHLFLSCRFSLHMWAEVFSRLSPRQAPFITWAELLSWCRLRSPSATPTLKKLVAQVLIYHVWRQRNSVLHNNTHLLQAETFKLIDRDVRNTITARRKRRKFTNIMALWIR
ncbi:hypothetical protein F2Q69_00022177 [Brassica cretica]|uniref:Reverse transcriptase zinc-binding domain-containing protein n=1 Tax=Brassica cretica TaxID=69181 RepID=A0A8S9Q273_BRACR|nr:hypothetical protein F2Q69_00022177 [Brassica cretica]